MDSGNKKHVSPHRHTATGEVSRDDRGQDNSISATPIYWQHRRHESYLSIRTTKPPPIILEDNTESNSDIKSPLWAKAVAINAYTVVSGSVPGVGDYITWNCKIDTLDVSIQVSLASSSSDYHTDI